ncbi:MAG: hypothetical protein ACREJC_03810, partial [Tepidisphaeraceae bacterium]
MTAALAFAGAHPGLFYLAVCLGAVAVLAGLLYIGWRRELRRDAIEREYEEIVGEIVVCALCGISLLRSAFKEHV